MITGLPKTVGEARESGSRWYFTGRPCRNGHVEPRYTASRGCKVCAVVNTTKFITANAALVKERSKTYNVDKERRRVSDTLRRKKHSRKHVERAANWARENPGRRREIMKEWIRANPGKHNANSALYRVRRAAAKCACCSKEDFEAFYQRASGLKMEVDHRQALALGGLHCIQNLQLLTNEEHLRKSADDRRAVIAQRGYWKRTQMEAA